MACPRNIKICKQVRIKKPYPEGWYCCGITKRKWADAASCDVICLCIDSYFENKMRVLALTPDEAIILSELLAAAGGKWLAEFPEYNQWLNEHQKV